MTNDEIKQEFAVVNGDWSEEQERRFNQPYDGFLGMVPEWFPDEYKLTFLCARENLVEYDCTSEEIKRWIEAEIGVTPFPWTGFGLHWTARGYTK